MKILAAQATSDLTIRDVAQELGLHTETVRRLLSLGELPGYKVGRHWRMTRGALDGFKENGGAKQPGRPQKGKEAE